MFFSILWAILTSTSSTSIYLKASAAARSTYDHSFAVRAGRLWNVLPRIVNTQKTLASFKISLGNFLDILPDKPPTSGFSAENSNSIIDWCSQGGGPQIAWWPWRCLLLNLSIGSIGLWSEEALFLWCNQFNGYINWYLFTDISKQLTALWNTL